MGGAALNQDDHWEILAAMPSDVDCAAMLARLHARIKIPEEQMWHAQVVNIFVLLPAVPACRFFLQKLPVLQKLSVSVVVARRN